MQSSKKQESASSARWNINIVAFTGYATAGKDVAADALVNRMGFTKLGFTDPIYDIACMINPWVWYWLMPCKLSKVVDAIGWTKAKKIKSVRNLLQNIGEGGRRYIHQDVWVDALQNKICKMVSHSERNWFVITNVRHPNEAQMVNSMGGVLYKIERPGVGPVNNHVSDQGLAFNMANATIVNDGSIEEFENKVLMHATQYLGERVCQEILGKHEFACSKELTSLSN